MDKMGDVQIDDSPAVCGVPHCCQSGLPHTTKTFIRYLNEIRISYACKLLNDDNYTITEVCFESGFNSLSYFNRQFNAMMNMSPMYY